MPISGEVISRSMPRQYSSGHISVFLANHSTRPSAWRCQALTLIILAAILSHAASLPETSRRNLSVANPAGNGGGGAPASKPALARAAAPS